MSSRFVTPIDKEVTFGTEQIIVSKTDLKGVITYANKVFSDVCGFQPSELIGKPHSIIRHPEFPGGVFKLLWDTIQADQEIFAYVKNMAKDGSFYWVLAHVSPVHDFDGNIVGYHSSRRCPSREAIAEIEPLYAQMLAEERKHSRKIDAAAASLDLVVGILTEAGITYDQFVWDLIDRTSHDGREVGRARVA